MPWAKELRHSSELEQESLWDLKLPTEYVPGTSRPAVDVAPTMYVVASDSTLVLITRKGKTLKKYTKYTLQDDLALRKADMILEIGHDMLWGKDLQQLCKANIAMTKDLMANFQLRFCNSHHFCDFWSGNEVCREYEPLPIWGQRDPQGDWNAIMDRVKGNIVWWNKQLKELGVDQAALISEPDPLTYGLGFVFTTFMDRLKAWVHAELAEDNERLRWIQNDKLPPRLELRDYFHAFERVEQKRNDWLRHGNTAFAPYD